MAVVVVALILITVDSRAGGSEPAPGAPAANSPLQPLRSGAALLIGPLVRAVDAVAEPVGARVQAVLDAGRDQREIDRIAGQAARLQAQLRSTDLDRQRLAQLDGLLRVSSVGDLPMVPAQVVGTGGSLGFERTVTIDAGGRDGLAAGMTVLNADGLVGRVTAVTPFTATVLLLLDGTSAVGVRLARTAEMGTVSGRGTDLLDLTVLDPAAPVQPGDPLVTLGDPSRFAAGVPVGEVVSVAATGGGLTRAATVRPYVDFTALDLVAVVLAVPRQPRDPLPRPGAGAG